MRFILSCAVPFVDVCFDCSLDLKTLALSGFVDEDAAADWVEAEVGRRGLSDGASMKAFTDDGLGCCGDVTEVGGDDDGIAMSFLLVAGSTLLVSIPPSSSLLLHAPVLAEGSSVPLFDSSSPAAGLDIVSYAFARSAVLQYSTILKQQIYVGRIMRLACRDAIAQRIGIGRGQHNNSTSAIRITLCIPRLRSILLGPQ